MKQHPMFLQGTNLGLGDSSRTPIDRLLSADLSTPASIFSTCRAGSRQLRDPNFVTPYSTAAYITTGVESRTSVGCAPSALTERRKHRLEHARERSK